MRQPSNPDRAELDLLLELEQRIRELERAPHPSAPWVTPSYVGTWAGISGGVVQAVLASDVIRARGRAICSAAPGAQPAGVLTFPAGYRPTGDVVHFAGLFYNGVTGDFAIMRYDIDNGALFGLPGRLVIGGTLVGVYRNEANSQVFLDGVSWTTQ